MFSAKLTQRPECPNCHPTLDYCPECGEKKFSERDFSFKSFFSGLAGDITDLDSKLLKTLWLLTFRPGFLTEEHCRGVNVPYIKPLRLFLIIAVANFLAFGFSHRVDMYSLDEGIFKSVGLANYLINWQPLQGHIKTNFDYGQVNKSIKDSLSVLIYLLLLIAAGFYFLLFRKKRKYYAEHLVFFLHILSAAFLRNFLLLPIVLLYPPLGYALFGILNFIYVFVSIRKFYCLSLLRTLATMAPTLVLVTFMMTFLWCLSVVFALWQ